jgi:hypothetical protein
MSDNGFQAKAAHRAKTTKQTRSSRYIALRPYWSVSLPPQVAPISAPMIADAEISAMVAGLMPGK